MKHSFLFIVWVIFFYSCDYVDNPVPTTNVNIVDTATCPAPVFPILTTHTKKILIEDFTGQTCPNCPNAARKLYKLDTANPGKVIGLGIHVGDFAKPNPVYYPASPGSFTSDFRTSVGDVYNDFFKPYGIGLPQGMFNRKDYDATNLTHLKFYSNWESYFSGIKNETPDVDLQIINDYDPATKKICCAVKTTFINNLSGNYKLTVLITQDSIVGWQDDLGTKKPDYVHRHVLRDAITPSGAWGETLVNGSATAGTSNVKRFAYVIPAQYNSIPCEVKHCHIVAFIYNTATYEVIQSEEAKVME